jgi:6,7-dimethyl-8-ribityllumazine synthase
MLTPVKTLKLDQAKGRFAIIASQYNNRYVDAMLSAAKAELKRAGSGVTVEVVRVPGAFEIPVVASRLARNDDPRIAAIICLGVILRGQTTHAEQIATGVTHALMKIQVDHAVPVIHEVLLLENKDQARVRCLGKKHNRGAEAAQTALQMSRIMRSLSA